jgi:hypothetical protein
MKDQINEIINNMTGSELIELNNRYCEVFDYRDDEIYNNDEEFFEIFFTDAMQAVRAVSFGDYRYHDDYVIFNGYGNLETFNQMNTDRLVDLVETMAEYIADKIEEFEDIIRLTDED